MCVWSLGSGGGVPVIVSFLIGLIVSQFLMASWLSNYSYLCQPVDYSTSPLAMRVSRRCGSC